MTKARKAALLATLVLALLQFGVGESSVQDEVQCELTFIMYDKGANTQYTTMECWQTPTRGDACTFWKEITVEPKERGGWTEISSWYLCNQHEVYLPIAIKQ